MTAAIRTTPCKPLPCPLPWSRALVLRDQPVCEGGREARALAAWLVGHGWTRTCAEQHADWTHRHVGAGRSLSLAALAQATAFAQGVLEACGWRLASGVVARVGGRALWLEAFELFRPEVCPSTEWWVVRALAHEGIDVRVAPAPLSCAVEVEPC